MMRHTTNADILNDMYGFIKKGRSGFDYKTCFRVIEYLYLNERISAEDFVLLSVYAALMYHIPVESVIGTMEGAARPITDKTVDLIFHDVPSSYAGNLNALIFFTMKKIARHILDENIYDYEALKTVLMERISEYELVLSENSLLFDDFPLSIFEDLNKLFKDVGYTT
ncbi:MAG: hypothetical protein K1X54_04780 [Flavobacteriales bacterium]|nr:hypothetical protein [Flavobacteriales bacterium]